MDLGKEKLFSEIQQCTQTCGSRLIFMLLSLVTGRISSPLSFLNSVRDKTVSVASSFFPSHEDNIDLLHSGKALSAAAYRSFSPAQVLLTVTVPFSDTNSSTLHTQATDTQVPQSAWTSKDSVWESILSFHHLSPRAQTQVVTIASRGLYLLTVPH